MRAFIGLLLVLVSTVIHARSYQFPFLEPFAATVVGTPVELQAPRLTQEQIRWREERVRLLDDNTTIPPMFWFAESLKYSVALQRKPAPLIFVIAGTGANASAAKMISLQRSFYTAGYHVIGLPSPTNPNFMVSALPSHLPGYPGDDAPALYRAMQETVADLKNKYRAFEATEYYLAGYSLGGVNAAFVAKHDEQAAVFNFRRVLMINPPVSLFNSARILDDLVDERGVAQASRFIVGVLNRLGSLLERVDGIRLTDSDYFYQLYLRENPEPEELQQLVGVVFRLFAMGITFTGDQLNRSNLLIPSGEYLGKYSTTTPFFLLGRYLGYVDYFDRLLLPALQVREPGLTREQVFQRMSLYAIRDYLATSTKIGLITNEDDFTLAPGELLFIKETFGNRSKIYPRGGHLGNLDEREFVANLLWFLQRR